MAILQSLLASCILLAAPLRASQFVYVTSLSDNSISAFKIESDGALLKVNGSPFSAPGGPENIAIDVGAKRIFVSLFYSYKVAGYTVASDGALTLVDGHYGKTPQLRPAGVEVDPRVHVVYSGGDLKGQTKIAGYQTSTLEAIPGSPFTPGNGSGGAFAVDSARGFLYMVEPGDNTVSGYSIAASGELTVLPSSPFATGSYPQGIAVDPAANLVYVTNGNDNTVWGYSIGSDGALSPVSGSPFATASVAGFVAVDPVYHFVYVTNNSGISGYKILTGGALVAVPNSPFATKSPINLAVDSTGKFLYVTNYNENTVSGYKVHSDGSLTPVTGSPFKTGKFPAGLAVF